MTSSEPGLSLYCIVGAEVEPLAGTTGLGESEVFSVRSGSLGMWVSASEEPPRPTIEGARIHDQVVRRAMDGDATPIPVRFGQWARSRQAVEEILDRNREGYTRALAHVAGSVEMGLTLAYDTADVPEGASSRSPGAGQPGRAYMEGLMATRRRRSSRRAEARRMAREMEPELEGLVEDVATPGGVVGPEVSRICHLVPKSGVGAYRAAVERFAGERGLDVSITGPWPPYSFAP